MKKLSFSLILCLSGLAATSHAADRLQDPYAICAHVSRGELAVATDEFKRLSEIPVNWVRTDYDWGGIQRNQETWNYDHLDKLITLSKAANVNILPILDYDVKWAHPAYKNLDLWAEYVQKTVSRYAKDIRYWEVWNEQNGFWDRPARGEDYTPLLKRSYEVIKAIDSDLQVLYGGTAGVPFGYIEATLKAGAAPYFDIMNVHPYNWHGTPESMIPQLKQLKELMAKYGVAHKPIWITEIGWSTAEQNKQNDDAFIAAFRHLGIAEKKYPLAVVSDQKTAFQRTPSYGNHFFNGIRSVKLDEIAALSPAECPVLVPCGGEAFPAKYHDALRAYMAKGGTIVLPSGLPFYYDIQIQPDGSVKQVQVNDRDVASFHIAWTSWWTHKGTPERMTFAKAAAGFESLKADWKGNRDVRFLDGRNLKEGDKMTPIVLAGDKDFSAPIIALYELNSDLKGNILACTNMQINECVPLETQAEDLPRTYLLAFAIGIDRVFWYNFRSWEGDPTEREHHFGIVHRDLSQKPSFYTYQALAKMCPSGSTRPELTVTDNIYQTSWTKTDGTPVCAIWTPAAPIDCKLSVEGAIQNAYDMNGKPIAIPNDTFKATTQLVYLEGATKITVSR
ncbi:MAG: hypothetical protein IKX30_15565 [Victivallales bacterium]|nr:hypothetical protein [Victivallales bacterium]